MSGRGETCEKEIASVAVGLFYRIERCFSKGEVGEGKEGGEYDLREEEGAYLLPPERGGVAILV